MKCSIKRNNQGQVTKVFNDKGEESILFPKIAKHPLMKSTEEAVGVYKNLFSKEMDKAIGEMVPKEDPYSKELYINLVHELPNGDTTTSFKDALERTEEGDVIKLGFSVFGDLKSVVTFTKSTDKETEEGFVMSMVENGYLSEERKRVGTDYRYQAGGETSIAKNLNAMLVLEDGKAHLGTTGVKKDGTTLTLEKTKGQVSVLKKDGSTELIDRNELDKMTYEELKEKYDNATDIIVQREWAKRQRPHRDTNLDISEPVPVRKEGELETRLLNLLAKMGIKTVSIAEYISKYKTRHGVSPSAKAIADIANEVIAYTTGNITDLTEETAHFINEVMPQEKVENVLRNIHKTQEWAEYSARYREVYSKEYSGKELDEVVRREVLGKIVAKMLANEAVTQAPTETQRNIYQVVWDAIVSFFANLSQRFKPQYQSELNQYLKEVQAMMEAEDISDHIELDNLKHNKFRFYNIYQSNDPAETIRKKASAIAFQLQDIEKQLLKAGSGTRTRIKDLEKIRKKLETALEVESIASLISIVNSSVKQVEAAIKDAKANENSYYLSAEENIIFQTLKGSAGAAVQEVVTLMTQLKARDKTNIWDALITEGKATSEKIGNLKAQVALIDSNNVQRLVDYLMDTYNFPAEDRKLIEKWIDKAEADTNLFHATFGQLVHAKDGLLNLQGFLIQDMHNYQQVKYYEATKKFQDKLAALGVTEEEIGRKFVDGQYIISPHDFNRFEEDTRNIYIASYRAAIAYGIPIMEAELQSGSLNADAEAAMRERLALYRDYQSKTDEEMTNLYVGRELVALSIEEELHRKEQERPHMVQKIERVMKDSYYEQYEQKLAQAGIRDITRQELSNQLADISFFKRKAFSRINGVLVMDFNTLSESEKLRYNELQKRRKMMKSYTNDQGKLKPGLGYRMVNGVVQLDADGQPIVYEENPSLMTDESIIAVDLHKLDATFEPNEQKEVANLFYAALNKVDREEGREAALEFLRLNSFMTFSQDFWNGLKPGNSIADRLRMAKVAPEEQATVNNLINNISKASFEMKNIMKMFNAKGNPAEIEVEFMPEATKDTVKELQEKLRGYVTEAKRILGEEAPEDNEDYLVGVSGVNLSYQKELKDLGIEEDSNDTPVEALNKANQEVDFAKKHMVNFNANTVENVRVSINNFLEGNSMGVHTAAQKVMDEWGYTPAMLRNPEIHARVLREVARSRVLPYYKRFTPEAFPDFEMQMRQTPNLAQFLTATTPGAEINRAFVEITPNHTFFNREENEELNPDYDSEFRGGYLQPKKTLYRNDKFYEMFGEIQTDPRTGEETSTKNQNLYQAYLATLEYNADALEAMNVGDTYNQYLLPQVRKRTIERYSKVFTGNIRDNIKNWTKESLTYTEDDLIQGEQMFGQDVKVIPKMYVNRLLNPEDVSNDLFYSLAIRAKEGFGREARVKYYGDLMSIHDKILARGMNGKDAKSSNTYRMAKSAIDFNLFGIKETATYPVKTPFGTIDVTKIARMLLNFVKFRNLGLNLIIPLTSWMTGEVTRKMEMFTGEFIDTRSQRLGNREFRKLVGQGMTEIGKINTKAKLNALGQYFNAFDLNESFENSNYSKWLRFLPRIGMVLHTGANYPIYGKTMLGVLHDYRVIEGKVMNKNDYKKLKIAQGVDIADINREWKEAEDEVIYKYIKHEGNRVELDVASLGPKLFEEGAPLDPEAQEAKVHDIYTEVQKHIQYVNSLVDGQIPEGDKVLAQRHYLLSYFMTHRGWLSIAVARRFKNRHLNLQTKLVEEGSYRSVWNYLGGVFNEMRDSNYRKFLGAFKDAYVNAEHDIERKNIIRVGIETGMLASIMILSLGLRYAAEDDENEDLFALQLTNHLTYRTMNELSSVQFNITSNFFEAIEAPFVGWNTMKNLTNIGDVFSGEEVQAGSYKGMTERGRFLTRMVPGAKQYFDLTNMNQTYDTYRFYNRRNFSLTPAAMLWNQTIDKK